VLWFTTEPIENFAVIAESCHYWVTDYFEEG